MNTISTETYRRVYRLSTLDKLLRKALVAEKICMVDRRGLKTIDSPYGSQPATVVQAIVGTYTPAAYTTTDDTLTVTDEFIVSEHVFDFEQTLTEFDIYAARQDEMMFSVAAAIDKYVLNVILEEGTGTYTTPAGGFTTAANVNTIMGALIGSVMGYSETFKGLYLVIENTDVAGFITAGASNGFNWADSVLKNGFMTNWMGVEIYVVRTGTFEDDATTSDSGSKTWTNLGHRLFGVRNTCTYAAPQGIKTEEKGVSGKTGKEIVVYGYVGAKVWASKAALTVDITLA